MNDLPENKAQKIFTANLIISLASCFLLTVWLVLSLFSVVQIESRYVFVFAVIPVVFFIFCNMIWNDWKIKNLKFPKSLPKKIFKTLPVLAFVLVFIFLIYGSINYPVAPIRRSGHTFRDKIGNEYTLEQFQDFQNWESALMISVAMFVLPLTALLPFYDKDSRTWKY